MEVWVIIRLTGEPDVLSVDGVFSSKEAALAALKDSDTSSAVRFTLDEYVRGKQQFFMASRGNPEGRMIGQAEVQAVADQAAEIIERLHHDGEAAGDATGPSGRSH